MAENKHATSRGRSLEVWMDFFKGSSMIGVGAFVVTPCYIWLTDILLIFIYHLSNTLSTTATKGGGGFGELQSV